MSELTKTDYCSLSNGVYTLNTDITLTGNHYFTLDGEIFDGNDHVITIVGVTGYEGLFRGLSNNPTIRNLGVVTEGNSTLYSVISDFSNAGWIVTYGQDTFTVEKCYSTGVISAYGSGGICGSSTKNAIINGCYSTGEISGKYAGGIAGTRFSDESNGDIVNTYSTGKISGEGAGGICSNRCGLNNIRDGLNCRVFVNNCYSSGEIAGKNSGGILGEQPCQYGSFLISNTYASGAISGDAAKGLFSQQHFLQTGVDAFFVYNCYARDILTAAYDTDDSSYEGVVSYDGNSVEIYYGSPVNEYNNYTIENGVIVVTINSAPTTVSSNNDLIRIIGPYPYGHSINYKTREQTTEDNLTQYENDGATFADVLNGSQLQTSWSLADGDTYPKPSYQQYPLVPIEYTLFKNASSVSLSQDTYYHTFYQVSQSNPYIMTSYTYDNNKNLLETFDISFGDYTVHEVLTKLDSGNYVIGSDHTGNNKLNMTIAYCDMYNQSFTEKQHQGIMSGVNNKSINDPP